MASAAQLAARPAVPRLPDGAYAVPDPQDPAVTTLWRVAYGELRPWPPRRRWAPRPPKADPSLTAEERRARRERWYAEVYWPWKLAVVEEIRRAPQAAADLFERLVPEHERPDAWLSALLEGHPTREELDQVERQADDEHRDRLRGVAALAAAALAAAGLPYRHIARALRISPWTAWQWARRGAELWQKEDGPEALTAALAALPPLDDLKVRPLPEDPDEAFTAWAEARFGVAPDDLAELLEAAATVDLDDLAPDVDQLAALLDDLPN
ncbi:hypothetical protein ACPCTG_32760 [Streptomyces pseudogriseolus]|uniref:hypothetical protein n=1 Tax=Streptomyces pseudogriseolus TaxID=36817 RepID=UPI003FA1E016